MLASKGRQRMDNSFERRVSLTNTIATPKEFCFILKNVEVGQVTSDGHDHCLSLTNLHFPTDLPRPMAFPVAWGTTTILVRLSPWRNYRERLWWLLKTGDIIPTAILRFQTQKLTGDEINQFITDFCLALSLVQGRKINWIHHAIFGPHGTFQRAVFGNTITKTDKVPPLCFIPSCTSATLALTAARDAVSAIKRFRETFDPHNRIINSWLDARTEADYLEGRTLKCVVVIEALIALSRRNDPKIIATTQNLKAWAKLYQRVVKSCQPKRPIYSLWQSGVASTKGHLWITHLWIN